MTLNYYLGTYRGEGITIQQQFLTSLQCFLLPLQPWETIQQQFLNGVLCYYSPCSRKRIYSHFANLSRSSSVHKKCIEFLTDVSCNSNEDQSVIGLKAQRKNRIRECRVMSDGYKSLYLCCSNCFKHRTNSFRHRKTQLKYNTTALVSASVFVSFAFKCSEMYVEREVGRVGWRDSEWEGEGEMGGGRWGEGDLEGRRGGERWSF